ncbi:MAG: DUF3574 domain-containing protein [Steroidobacteraceae bacterium]
MAIAAAIIALSMPRKALEQELTCPLAIEKPMLIIQLFFSQSIESRGPVTAKEWKTFLKQAVTPRFPAGFTVYDGYGQWLNPKTHSVTRQNSKVLVIAVQDSAGTRAKISELSELYRKDFHQQATGIITNQACAAF